MKRAGKKYVLLEAGWDRKEGMAGAWPSLTHFMGIGQALHISSFLHFLDCKHHMVLAKEERVFKKRAVQDKETDVNSRLYTLSHT